MANVRLTQRSEHRIRYRVGKHISIRVALESLVMRYFHTTKNEGADGLQEFILKVRQRMQFPRALSKATVLKLLEQSAVSALPKVPALRVNSQLKLQSLQPATCAAADLLAA